MRALLSSLCLFATLLCAGQQPFDLDPGFDTDIGSFNISSLVPLPDGKVLVAGRFDYPGETLQLGLGRLLHDGNWDLDFAASALIRARLTPWNNKFYGLNQGVRRVLADGTLDNGFDMVNAPMFTIGLGGDYFVYPDGRILMTGTHHLSDTARGYVGDYNLIWFSNTGYLDTTAHHRACDGHINYIHPLSDGKFLLGGFWNEYDGTPLPNSTHLIRVFPDGALDTSFQCPVNWGSVVCHHQLANGRHLITGTFTENGDPDTMQVVRLLPDGAIDESYNNHQQYLYPYGSAPSYAGVIGLLPMDESRMIVVGGFTTVGNEARGGIALLDSLGNVLPDHFVDAGCGVWNDGFMDHAYIAGIVPAPDGSFYIHGSYHGYDDGTANYPGQRMVSRLYGLDVGVREEQRETWEVYPNPSSGSFSLRGGGNAPVDVALYDGLGRLVRRWNNASSIPTFNVQQLPAGLYTLRVESQTTQVIRTIIASP